MIYACKMIMKYVESPVLERINVQIICSTNANWNWYLTSLWNKSSTEAWLKLGGTQSAFSFGKAEMQHK